MNEKSYLYANTGKPLGNTVVTYVASRYIEGRYYFDLGPMS